MDMDQPSLPLLFFILFSVSAFVSAALSTIFYSMNSGPSAFCFPALFFRSYFCLFGPFDCNLFLKDSPSHFLALVVAKAGSWARTIK